MSERKAKTLIFDIETSPIIGFTWGVWEQNVIEVIEDWQVLSVAWKWLGDKKVQVVGQDDFPSYVAGTNNDFHVIEKIHELFCEADIIVAHNGNKFDQKKVVARMICHNMNPPSPYKQIDTLRVVKEYSAFTHNSLKQLAIKLETKNQKADSGGFETWKKCLAGDTKAWAAMKKYNKQDITTLEELYLKLRPWMKNHPNVARLENQEGTCPKCGSFSLQSRGYRSTNTFRYKRLQCQDCGGWCSERTSDKEVKPPKFTSFS